MLFMPPRTSRGETLTQAFETDQGDKLVPSDAAIACILDSFSLGPFPGWWLGGNDGRKAIPPGRTRVGSLSLSLSLHSIDLSGVNADMGNGYERAEEPVSFIVSTESVAPKRGAYNQTFSSPSALALMFRRVLPLRWRRLILGSPAGEGLPGFRGRCASRHVAYVVALAGYICCGAARRLPKKSADALALPLPICG